MEEPDNQTNNRNEDGTFKKGMSGNPAGRPKGTTLKEYQAQKFREMTDDEKEEWLKSHNVNGETRWRMAEGNPQTNTDLTTDGEQIIFQVVNYGDNKPTT